MSSKRVNVKSQFEKELALAEYIYQTFWKPRKDEKDTLFIRDREKVGEKEAFHKLHRSMEEALAKTKYFKSYTG